MVLRIIRADIFLIARIIYKKLCNSHKVWYYLCLKTTTVTRKKRLYSPQHGRSTHCCPFKAQNQVDITMNAAKPVCGRAGKNESTRRVKRLH